MDHISREHRSWNMSRIKSKNTKPEILVRSLIHRLGYRFRLHGKISKKIYQEGYLPGKPDIVLKKYKTVIFVHGCFWHRHKNCKRATIPKTRTDWWLEKFNSNIQRDKENVRVLQNLGWKIVIIWECELQRKDYDALKFLIKNRLEKSE